MNTMKIYVRKVEGDENGNRRRLNWAYSECSTVPQDYLLENNIAIDGTHCHLYTTIEELVEVQKKLLRILPKEVLPIQFC